MVLFIFVRKMPFSCNTSFSILCICLQKAHLFCSQYFHLQVYVALIWLRSVPHVFEQRHTHTYHQWPWAAAVEGCYWHYSFAICRPVSAFPPRSGRSARCSRSILSSRQHCRWAVMEPLEYNKNTRSSQHAHLWPGLAKWVWMHTG